jgi:cell division protein FtsL
MTKKMNTIWVTAIITIVISALGIISAISSARQAVNDAKEAAENEARRADESAKLLEKTNQTLCNTRSSLESMSLLLTKADKSLSKADENLTNSQNMLEQQRIVIESQGKLLEGYTKLVATQAETLNHVTGAGLVPKVILQIRESNTRSAVFQFYIINPSEKYPIHTFDYQITQFSTSSVGKRSDKFILLTPKSNHFLHLTTMWEGGHSEMFEIVCNWRDGTYKLFLTFELDERNRLHLKFANCSTPDKHAGDYKPYIDINFEWANNIELN